MPSLNNDPTALDLETLREKLAQTEGKTFWRGLEELADSPPFREMLHREFPEQASEWTSELSRRRFLSLMGASLALAGLAGCSRSSREVILPYIEQPEGLIQGKPLFFASALTLAGFASGVLVESHMGRPTKIEGNPDHPASLGASDVFGQASILGLYDPDREQAITYLGRVRSWADFSSSVRKRLDSSGPGLRILTGNITSPTTLAQLEALFSKEQFRDARWHVHEPGLSDNALEGARLAFGDRLQPRYRLAPVTDDDPDVRADVILALDADFLTSGPGHLRYAREFASRRNPDKPMNRLYCVESMFTATGGMADHRLPLKSSDIEAFARRVASKLGVAGIDDDKGLSPKQTEWADAVADDLRKVDGGDKDRPLGTTVVIAGDGQPQAVHALAYAINAKLGNLGKTVEMLDPLGETPKLKPGTLAELVEDIDTGKVRTLVVLGGNPVFTAPGALQFGESLRRAKNLEVISWGLYHDETARLSHWHIPAAHELETWGDARAFDGTASIQQPLIDPLYGGKDIGSVIAALADETGDAPRDRLQRHWRRWWQADDKPANDFDRFWKRSLHRGVVIGTGPSPRTVDLRPNFAADLPKTEHGDWTEVVFRPDPTIFDGQFANNGWLQETPKPVTKLTWDNAACMSPNTAKKLGVSYSFGYKGGEHGEAIADMVKIVVESRTLVMPVWIVPGHADDSVTVHLGYGRRHSGKVGTNVGFDVYGLRSSAEPGCETKSEVLRDESGRKHTLACVQGHHSMEGRELIRSATLQHYKKDEDFAHHSEHHGSDEHKAHPLTMFPPHKYPDRKWGMSVNLGTCTGCNACVVACQAENNLPVVGKEEVVRGREMHWLRIDRYFVGNPFDEPEQLQLEHQPVMCQHCDNAPCEIVCPVAATVHSFDGLNDMVYNRCVGTRYCSNNCPYKVRRFNFMQYADYATESLKLMRNPEVTVRTVGVMEKCTYCVQRIRSAEIEAEKQGRPIRDGEVVTACQSACPTQAIVFGDTNDSESEVSKLKKNPRDYGILTELNTEPATSYLAAVRNPNPAMSAHE